MCRHTGIIFLFLQDEDEGMDVCVCALGSSEFTADKRGELSRCNGTVLAHGALFKHNTHVYGQAHQAGR